MEFLGWIYGYHQSGVGLIQEEWARFQGMDPAMFRRLESDGLARFVWSWRCLNPNCGQYDKVLLDTTGDGQRCAKCHSYMRMGGSGWQVTYEGEQRLRDEC